MSQVSSPEILLSASPTIEAKASEPKQKPLVIITDDQTSSDPEIAQILNMEPEENKDPLAMAEYLFAKAEKGFNPESENNAGPFIVYLMAISNYEKAADKMKPETYLNQAKCISKVASIFWKKNETELALGSAKKCIEILEDEKLIPRSQLQDTNYRDLIRAKDILYLELATKRSRQLLGTIVEILKLYLGLKNKIERDKEEKQRKRENIYNYVIRHATTEHEKALAAHTEERNAECIQISNTVIDLFQFIIDDTKKNPGFLAPERKTTYLTYLYSQLAQFNLLLFKAHVAIDNIDQAICYSKKIVLIVKDNGLENDERGRDILNSLNSINSNPKAFKKFKQLVSKNKPKPMVKKSVVSYKIFDEIIPELTTATAKHDFITVINLLGEANPQELADLESKTIRELQREEKESSSQNCNDSLSLLACIMLVRKNSAAKNHAIAIVESLQIFNLQWDHTSNHIKYKNFAKKMSIASFAKMLRSIQKGMQGIAGKPDLKRIRKNIKEFLSKIETKEKSGAKLELADSEKSVSDAREVASSVENKEPTVPVDKNRALTPEELVVLEKLAEQIKNFNIDAKEEDKKLAALEDKIKRGQEKLRALKVHEHAIYAVQITYVGEKTKHNHKALVDRTVTLEAKKTKLLAAMESDNKPSQNDLEEHITEFATLQKLMAANFSQADNHLHQISAQIKNNLIKQINEYQLVTLTQKVEQIIAETKSIFSELDTVIQSLSADESKEACEFIASFKAKAATLTQEIESVSTVFHTKCDSLLEKNLAKLSILELQTLLNECKICNTLHQRLIQKQEDACNVLKQLKKAQDLFLFKQKIQSCTYEVADISELAQLSSEITQNYPTVLETMDTSETKVFTDKVKPFLHDIVAVIDEQKSLLEQSKILEQEAKELLTSLKSVGPLESKDQPEVTPETFLKQYENFAAQRDVLKLKIDNLIIECRTIKSVIECRNKLFEIKRLPCDYKVESISESGLFFAEIKRDYKDVLSLMNASEAKAFDLRVNKFLQNCSIAIEKQESVLAEANSLEKDANELVAEIEKSDLENDELFIRATAFLKRQQEFNAQRLKIKELLKESHEINGKISSLWPELKRKIFISQTEILTIKETRFPTVSSNSALVEQYRKLSLHARNGLQDITAYVKPLLEAELSSDIAPKSPTPAPA